MNIHEQISQIKTLLISTFSEINNWFSKDQSLIEYKPAHDRWSVHQILEHISLTNHFLLILIEKGANRALLNSKKLDLDEELKNYTFQKEKLDEVGLHKEYAWIRPEHMEPNGIKSLEEVQDLLKAQLKQCMDTLAKLPNGEGILAKTMMSVNDIGKIDVYEYIYFLAQHGQRHLTQMQKVEEEFKSVMHEN